MIIEISKEYAAWADSNVNNGHDIAVKIEELCRKAFAAGYKHGLAHDDLTPEQTAELRLGGREPGIYVDGERVML